MEKISWHDSVRIIMGICDNKLRSLEIETEKFKYINKGIINFDKCINNEIFCVNFDHDICKFLHIKGLNVVKALEIAKDYVNNMGIQYDAEIFGGAVWIS